MAAKPLALGALVAAVRVIFLGAGHGVTTRALEDGARLLYQIRNRADRFHPRLIFSDQPAGGVESEVLRAALGDEADGHSPVGDGQRIGRGRAGHVMALKRLGSRL